MVRDVAAIGQPEAIGDGADDAEAQRAPQAHGVDVGADDGVELHGAVAQLGGEAERGLTHRAPRPMPRRSARTA